MCSYTNDADQYQEIHRFFGLFLNSPLNCRMIVSETMDQAFWLVHLLAGIPALKVTRIEGQSPSPHKFTLSICCSTLFSGLAGGHRFYIGTMKRLQKIVIPDRGIRG